MSLNFQPTVIAEWGRGAGEQKSRNTFLPLGDLNSTFQLRVEHANHLSSEHCLITPFIDLSVSQSCYTVSKKDASVSNTIILIAFRGIATALRTPDRKGPASKGAPKSSKIISYN